MRAVTFFINFFLFYEFHSLGTLWADFQCLAVGVLLQFSTPPPCPLEFQERSSRIEKRIRKCLTEVALSGTGLFILFIYYLFVFNSHPSVFFQAPRTGECLLGERQAVQMLSVLMLFFPFSFSLFWFLFMGCWTRLVILAVFVFGCRRVPKPPSVWKSAKWWLTAARRRTTRDLR